MLNIIIVEDEEIIRKGLVHTIPWDDFGCRVVGDAPDGLSGLELIRQQKPDLVLTDIIMPSLNGLEMLQRAREDVELTFDAIVLTSYTEFSYARKALQLGAADYLLKPVDEQELEKVVAKIRASRQRQTEVRQEEELILVDWSQYLNAQNLCNSYVSQTLYRIRDHYDEKLSIEALADEFAVSASYLSRKFKEATGHTFGELLSKYRIQKAIALLQQGTYRVYEVSDRTGFSDYKNFCVVFKKYMQCSPKEYRKEKFDPGQVKQMLPE